MGAVWRAHDERLNRTVALKELLIAPGLAQEDAQSATDRAMREGRIAARLQHPHAICVYDVALDTGTAAGSQMVPWLVMEYLASRSLAAVLLEYGTLAPHEAARIGWQVASALTAAHAAGIVHRDVKPGNVLLGQDGTAKITDFGISRASWDATVTSTGVLAGTPAYFAPEVARGEAPGPASDVFSLGSTLYVAVEGVPPFGVDDNALAMLRTVAEGRVRPAQQAGPLSAFLMRLLADDPAARPTMAQAVAALGAVIDRSEAAPPASRTPRAHTPAALVSTMLTAVDLPASPPRGRTPARRPTTRGALRWRRPAVLFAAASCLVVLAIVLGVVSNVAGPTADRGRLAVATPAAAPPPDANALPAPVPAAPAQPAPLQPAELEQTVRTYYGLLPQDTTAAWQYLGTEQRAQGLQQYSDFWNGINRVNIRGPVAVQGNTVLVNLVFEPANRNRTLERYRLTLGNTPDGRVLIQSAARISGVTLTAAQHHG
ncbi:MAG: serine/threonine protein kinase [Actinomycetota bacterium]|nr:serine/threonine protein kinase [Actinomycetota bacterium]